MAHAAALLLALAGTQVSDQVHKKVYDKAAPSVVAIRVEAKGENSGSGVVLSEDGLILTSAAVCPKGSTKIRVWTWGPRKYEGEIVAVSPKHEITLLRIKPKEPLRPIEFGDSAKAKLGDLSYTLGNAANSMIDNDQAALNVGVLSGAYRLGEARAMSAYTGPVFETTAAVNVGMGGAPCLDAEGRMVGFVTLNYSPHRFLGTAIPLDEIKHVIDRLRAPAAAAAADPAAEGGEAWLGLKARDEGGRVVVEEVEKDSPAAEAGLRKGDVLLEIGAARLARAADIAARLKDLEAGTVLWLKVEAGGSVESVKVVLEKKK